MQQWYSHGRSLPRFLAVLAILVSPFVVRAQSVQRIDASQSPACQGCSLVFTKMATLGRIDDAVFPGVGMHGSGFTMNSKGQFLVTSLGSDQVVVYDRNGKFVRTIGQKGNGPGEFRQARHLVVDPTDTLYVLDVGRISVFSPTFTYVRTITIFADAPKDLRLLPNNAILLNYGGRYRGGPLQLALDAGKQKPFPQDTTSYGPCTYVYCNLAIGRGTTPDKVWSSWNTRYTLQEWNSNGNVQRTVSVVGSTWHKNTDLAATPSRDVPPVPVLVAVGEDSRKQLWVLGETPSRNWKPYVETRSLNAGRSGSNIGIGAAFAGPETLKRLITVVDIFDLTSNRMVLSQTFPNRKLFMIAPGYFAEVREDQNDIPVWDVFRAEIRKP